MEKQEEIKINKEVYSNNYSDRPIEPSKKSIPRKILEGMGIGSLFIGGGIISIIFYILSFLFTASVGLLMIGRAISLFIEGSIFWGILTLILTPLAIGLAHHLFFFFIILGILSGILWGIVTILGFDISFWTAESIIWLIVKIAILGIMAFSGIWIFTDAVKQKNVLSFLKNYWWGILLFCFLFWLFFL